MSPRSINWWWLAPLTLLFYFGIRLPETTSLHTLAFEILLVGFSFALAASITASSKTASDQPNAAVMRALLEAIHAEVTAHLQRGHNMLVPGDGSGLASRVSLGLDGPDVIIEELPPGRRALRRYTVAARGRLSRTIIPVRDVFASADDVAWRDSMMTEQRLRSLLKSLQSHKYIPCYEGIG